MFGKYLSCRISLSLPTARIRQIPAAKSGNTVKLSTDHLKVVGLAVDVNDLWQGRQLPHRPAPSAFVRPFQLQTFSQEPSALAIS